MRGLQSPTCVIPESPQGLSGTHMLWAIRRDQALMGPGLPQRGNRDDTRRWKAPYAAVLSNSLAQRGF